MALRDGYLGEYAGAAAIRSGYRLDQSSDAVRAGYDPQFVSQGPRPLSIGGFRDLRGRDGIAMPAGIVLPAGRGGTAPYTYSTSGRPAGINFAAGTRTLSGTPAAAGNNTVTYTVRDSASPRATATTTFAFNVVASDVEATLDDWDNRGYGVSTLNPVVLALFESDTNVVGTEATVGIFARQNRGNAGFLLDADGAVTADLSPLTLPGPAGAPIFNWIRLHPNNGRITLNQSNMDAAGVATGEYSFSDNFPSGSVCYLQDKQGVVAIPLDSAGGGFMRFRPTAGQNEVASENLMARLDSGVHYILALTLP